MNLAFMLSIVYTFDNYLTKIALFFVNFLLLSNICYCLYFTVKLFLYLSYFRQNDQTIYAQNCFAFNKTDKNALLHSKRKRCHFTDRIEIGLSSS